MLERDPAPVPKSPDDAWQGWTRSGVAQFRQPHYLHPRVLHILDAELPDVRDALVTAGAQRFDTLRSVPPSLPRFERRPDDARFVALTARRATLEHVIARVAATEPRVQVRRGVAVSALVTEAATRGGSGVPHVFGVRTDGGEELHADLVVDAMGRRSPLPRWLEAAGAAPLDEESEPSGFVYYTRYFHSKSGVSPDPRDRLLAPVGSLSILTLPGDNGTWSVTLFGSADDRPLTQLRHADRWMSVVAAFPLHAHWLEGEPLTDVLPMAGILDRRRRLAPHGQRS